MKKWMELEIECCEYLNNQYSKKFNVNFVHLGEHNSEISDILVYSRNKEFFIEVKGEKSQCAQFVLVPNLTLRKFIFSPLNKTKEDQNSETIIAFMNKNFDSFLNKKNPIKIDLPKSIYINWIIHFYESKGNRSKGNKSKGNRLLNTPKNAVVKFVITKFYDHLKDPQFLIFPIENIGNYFDIKCIYRRKRSGSRSLSKKDIEAVGHNLNKIANLKFDEIETENKNNYYVRLSKNLKGYKFSTDDQHKYIITKDKFCEENDDIYVIRRLSNTENYNVIFSLSRKENQQNLNDLAVFEKWIED